MVGECIATGHRASIRDVRIPVDAQYQSPELALVLLKSKAEGRMKASAMALTINQPHHVLRRARVRILVVDQARDELESITSWLESREGVDVQGFSSAEEALTQSSGDSYDLCLLDYGLDGVDGVMLGAMIRALNPGAQMVLMAGILSPAIKRQAVEHGFQRILSRPLSPETLIGLLDE